MPLLSCRLCGKIFTSAGGRTCPACLERLDEIYPKVRQFIRDNPKTELDVETLAEKTDTDIRDVQSLVDMGYLDRELDGRKSLEDTQRQKLAQEFENSLKEMKEAAAKHPASVTYGQQRYAEKDKMK